MFTGTETRRLIAAISLQKVYCTNVAFIRRTIRLRYAGEKMNAGLLVGVCFVGVAMWGQETSGSVVGSVTDETGGPIPGALVILKSDQADWRSTTTRTNGDYSFENLPTGDYHLELQAAGFQTGRVSSFKIVPSEKKVIPPIALGVSSCANRPLVARNQSLSAWPERSGLRGTVFDLKDRQIAKVNIEITRVDEYSSTFSQNSDAHGRFGFSELQPGEYRLTAEKVFYYPEIVQLRLM